jgi:hypothetical protein
MPPRSRKQHLCDCPRYCMTGGRTEPKLVSKTTYHDHAPFRTPRQPPAVQPMAEFLAQHTWHPAAALPQPRHPSPTPSVPRCRARSLSADPISRSPTGEPPQQRQRRMDLDPGPDGDRGGDGEGVGNIGAGAAGETGSPRRSEEHYSDDSDIYVRVRISTINVHLNAVNKTYSKILVSSSDP